MEHIAKLIEIYKVKGYTWGAIAKGAKVSTGTVYNWLRTYYTKNGDTPSTANKSNITRYYNRVMKDNKR